MAKNKGKYLAYVLRHGYTTITGKNLPEGGWVDLSVLHGLGLSRDEVITIVNNDNKSRFELNGESVRASQGHSIESNIEYETKTPPDMLFHGTTVGAWMDIKNLGLSKMSRHAVHMTDDIEIADMNARRWNGMVPVILSIDSRAMVEDGVEFQVSNNKVWLVDNVPPKYLKVHKTYWNK